MDVWAGAGLGMVFLLAITAFAVAGFVVWVMALIECVRFSDPVYRAAGSEKVTWILVIALLGWLGAIIYWFTVRPRLRDAEAAGVGAVPSPYAPAGPPPGWYPNPQARGLRWWDGRQWTDHVSDHVS